MPLLEGWRGGEMEVVFDTRRVEGADEVVWVYFPEVNHVFPIAGFTCDLCSRGVSLSEVAGGRVVPSRIGGDSRFGYVVTHRDCVER